MFSKACKYGIRAVLYLAVHSSVDHKLGAKDVAEALDVPKPYLAKILQQLSKHNLISSSKGTGGGFYLNKENEQINLKEIIDCIDGEDMFSACILGLPICSSKSPCSFHTKAALYREGLLDFIENNSIEDFAEKIVKNKLTL